LGISPRQYCTSSYQKQSDPAGKCSQSTGLAGKKRELLHGESVRDKKGRMGTQVWVATVKSMGYNDRTEQAKFCTDCPTFQPLREHAMKTIRPWISGALLAAMCSGAACAGDLGTLYTQLGTNGLGLGYGASVSENWALRGQFNSYKRSYSADEAGDFGSTSTLTADFNLNSVQLLGDWYPGSGGFRLTGGAVFNNNKLTVNGKGKVNGIDANVNGELKMSDGISPYFGLGYSSRPKSSAGFGFNFDFGLMSQNPKASLSATTTGTGTGSGLALPQSDVDAQTRKMQDAADKFKIFPAIGLGISYSF
jgi:hypothetical protein